MSNPSIPTRPTPRRPLTDEERATLTRVADLLMPGGSGRPAASAAPDYRRWLERALVARDDAFETIVTVAAPLRDLEGPALLAALRTLSAERRAEFDALSAVLAGAYLMVPEIRRAIGYPGQEARPARFDEAADEIMDGILEPVLARGRIYRPTDATIA